MEKLYKIAKLCVSHRPVLESLINLQKQEKMWDLYDLLYADNQLTNSEAVLKVYGTHKAKQFSMLKAKMFGLLIKTVSTLDLGSDLEADRYSKVIENSRKNLAARIILSNGERGLAIKIFEDLLKSSKAEQISLNALEQLKILFLHYGATRYNKFKLKKYLELEKEFFHIASSESKAIRYYVELKKIQIQSLATPGSKEIAKANKYAKRLLAIKGANTRLFLFYRFQVIIKKLEYERQFEEVLALCDQAELDFSSSELSSRTSLIIVKQIQLWALIQVGRYRECIINGLTEIDKQHISPINWYSSVHYTLKAYLYSQEYSLASRLLIRCMNHKNFKKLDKGYKEVVNIHLGYIHLIVDSGIAGDPEELQKKLPDFKLGKFLNTVPVFSKDKRGINVSIHLMHIAFLLQRKDYNRIIDRVDSLNQYAYRYLRKDDSFRSNCMIKMVIQMTKADFNPIRTERYTRDLRQQLGTITLAGSGENIEVEMIPFEVLWDIMMRAL